MNLEDCLPADLQGPATTITRVAAGLSGAGVYRVEAAGEPFVLKIAVGSEPFAAWRRPSHARGVLRDRTRRAQLAQGHDRAALERLCRYGARLAFAHERLAWTAEDPMFRLRKGLAHMSPG